MKIFSLQPYTNGGGWRRRVDQIAQSRCQCEIRTTRRVRSFVVGRFNVRRVASPRCCVCVLALLGVWDSNVWETNVVAWRRGTRFWVGKNPVNLRGISIVLLPGVETVDTDHLVTISERSSKQLCGIGFN